MDKLLVICGPTATGKTNLAFNLAKKFNGELVSADSKMVYKYMDIGTGKDKDKYGTIFGYDLVNPNEEFSVSHYIKFAENKIEKIIDQKKLPILVGGTGLYIKALLNGIETIEIKPNKKLRKEYSTKSAVELFEILKKINPQKANSLNESDRKNPRRLIRAIEIFSQISEHNIIVSKPRYDVLMIGLQAPKEILKEKIAKRVDERVNLGFEKEIGFLRQNNFWEGAPKFTLGYKDWPDIKKWKLEEFKYAKRQITWFKKDQRINWFNITHKNYEKEVEKLIRKWYA